MQLSKTMDMTHVDVTHGGGTRLGLPRDTSITSALHVCRGLSEEQMPPDSIRSQTPTADAKHLSKINGGSDLQFPYSLVFHGGG